MFYSDSNKHISQRQKGWYYYEKEAVIGRACRLILFTAACAGACPAAVEEAIRRRGSMKGDVKGDGKSDITDATLIRMNAAKLTAFSEVQSETADINGDDKVDVSDASLVQRLAAKLFY